MAGVLIVVDVAQAHDGSLGILHSFIDALAPLGIDAIKFQIHLADAESSEHEPFRTPFSYVDKTRRDYWRRMELAPEQWREIKRHCEDGGQEFMGSPFSCAALDLLERLDVARHKIPSGEVSNLLLLERIARTGKPMILSSGMSDFRELDQAVDLVRPLNDRISILQCTTEYPTSAERIGVNVLPELRRRYGTPVGISDHSGTIYPAIAAVALGATVVEVHVTFDRRMFGPDSTSSLTVDELARLVEGVRFMERAMAHPVDKSDASSFAELRRVFGKSLAVGRALPAGHVVSIDDLEAKKPGDQGIPARAFRDVLGRTLTRAKDAFDFLRREDLA